MPSSSTYSQLSEIAAARLGSLSPAERKLFGATERAEIADCRSLSQVDRKIRPQCLMWLCTSSEATARVTIKGVQVVSAMIDGDVDLEWAKISFPLRFEDCVFAKNVIFRSGNLLSLDLTKSELSRLDAEGAIVERDILLSGLRCPDVFLVGATIGGQLVCTDGQLISQSVALNANGAKIGGSVFLNTGFRAKGTVELVAATIGGQLNCTGGLFLCRGEALNANGASIGGSILMDTGFKAEGTIVLVTATIGGQLNCTLGKFEALGGAPALNASGASIAGDVYFPQGFQSEGAVQLIGSILKGQLICTGGQFKSESEALNANGANIGGSVFLDDGFKAEGTVEFGGAIIRGQLNCTGGEFRSRRDALPALNANGAGITGDVYLRNGFKAEGAVALVGTIVGGQFSCTEGQFKSQGDELALDASGAVFKEDVLLRKIKADGEVSFQYARVSRVFQWREATTTERTVLRLNAANAGVLFNDSKDLNPGNLLLDDFVYDQIDDRALPNAEAQLLWIHRQPPKKFSSQPYEQLASVFRKRGLPGEARKVLIQKNRDYAAHSFRWHDFWRPEWWWYRVFGSFIGYGYRPGIAFVMSLCVVSFGWLFFQLGYQSALIKPTGDKAYFVTNKGEQRLSNGYPKFNSFAYSLETFVPLMRLALAERWLPNAKLGGPTPFNHELGRLGLPRTWGSALRYYLWFHIAAGWVLTSLWIGALTGLVKS